MEENKMPTYDLIGKCEHSAYGPGCSYKFRAENGEKTRLYDHEFVKSKCDHEAKQAKKTGLWQGAILGSAATVICAVVVKKTVKAGINWLKKEWNKE